MKTLRRTFWVATALCLFMAGFAFAQATGDYRSAANGNWSVAATWETFDGADWVAATTAPTGAETITVRNQDSVRVDVPVVITGYVAVVDTGVIEVTDGSLEFGDGSTYEHGRDEGNVPTATWGAGSTFLLTGTENDAPDNRNQNYNHMELNTPNMSSNNDLGLDDVTISGDIRVVDSGSARWRLTSASAEDTSIVTIMGDVIVEGGSFETQGTGNALTTFIVHHFGNINVTAGTFGISRGSQGNGSGTTTWFMYEGNVSISNAEVRNSNPTEGNAKFVFARGDTQQITFDNVEFGGGDIHYEVSDSTTLEMPQSFVVNGLLRNMGEVVVRDSLTFIEGGVYDHARDGGSVPSAVWEAGSEVRFTGIITDAPDNRGQDYYNLTLNTPGMLSNEDLSLDGNTISGNITVVNTGSARWRLVGGDSGLVTIMGDVFVQGGSFETLGTSSPTVVEVHHFGNVDVTGGTFAVSRGSQGNGAGSTRWFMHEGNFSIADATTRNSNPDNAWFVFDNAAGVQIITLTNVDYGSGGLSIEVFDGATLDFGTSELGGDGLFLLNDGATLATANVGGVDSTIQTTGDVTLSEAANFTFNGTEAQVTGTLMPMTVNGLTIDNEAGVTLSQETTINGVLRLVAGIFDNTIPFTLGVNGSISFEGGDLLIPVSVEETPGIPTEFALRQNYPNPFNPSTTISYDLPKRTHVTLKVYDVMGREVATLVDDDYEAGAHEIVWDASGQASGVYFYRISAEDFTSVRKLLLMK